MRGLSAAAQPTPFNALAGEKPSLMMLLPPDSRRRNRPRIDLCRFVFSYLKPTDIQRLCKVEKCACAAGSAHGMSFLQSNCYEPSA